VLCVANRAVGAPINILNDHSDSMSQRDSGWLQLYAADNQAAVDLHVLAFALAEQLSLPVMVCVDGFVLTHAFEPLELPDQQLVDEFLPPFVPRESLDPAEPVTIGAMVGPDAFTEVKYLAQLQQLRGIDIYDALEQDYRRRTGRAHEAVSGYRLDGAGTVVVALGSVTGTLRQLADELAEGQDPVGVLGLTLFRPFPTEQVRSALAQASRVVVVERAVSLGAAAGGPVSADVRCCLSPDQQLFTVVCGLGGRPITRQSLSLMLAEAAAGQLAELSFLDLDVDLVEREVHRLRQLSAPIAGPV
jgi:pyruvate ferredoxin oxidoreductase alpha subunit